MVVGPSFATFTRKDTTAGRVLRLVFGRKRTKADPVGLIGTEAWDKGFIRDSSGNLSVTTTPDSTTFGAVVPGFLTDADGRLVVAESSGDWNGGFIRTTTGALCVTTGSVTDQGTKVPGFPTDASGLLCVANDGTPAASSVFPGFMFDNGKLCVTGLSGGSATLYSESFTATGVSGWTTQNASVFRDTSAPHTAPGCLFFGFNDFVIDCLAFSPYFAATAIDSVAFWLKKGGPAPADVTAGIAWYDASNNVLGFDALDTFDNSFSSSWTSKSYGPLSAAPPTSVKAQLLFSAPDSSFWDAAGFFVDDILIEGTA